MQLCLSRLHVAGQVAAVVCFAPSKGHIPQGRWYCTQISLEVDRFVVQGQMQVQDHDTLASQPLDITDLADDESYELPTAEPPHGVSGGLGGRSGASYNTTASGVPRLESFRTAVEPDGDSSNVANMADLDTTT